MRNIITISREYGSGGRLIGQMVAENLKVPFYDKEIISLVAQKSGFTLEYVEQTGEYAATGSYLFNLATTYYAHSGYSEATLSNADRLHILQSKVIREIADKGPCVIVGRSADFILKDRPDCLNVFIHSDMAHKIERAVKYFGIAQENAERELSKKDKLRARHYKHYTGRTWGMAQQYHVSLDSGLLGVEGCRDIIVRIARK